jgi:hypothetical protein
MSPITGKNLVESTLGLFASSISGGRIGPFYTSILKWTNFAILGDVGSVGSYSPRSKLGNSISIVGKLSGSTDGVSDPKIFSVTARFSAGKLIAGSCTFSDDCGLFL